MADTKDDAIREFMHACATLSGRQKLEIFKLLKERLESELVGVTLLFEGPEGNIQMASDGKEVFMMGASVELSKLRSAVISWTI